MSVAGNRNPWDWIEPRWEYSISRVWCQIGERCPGAVLAASCVRAGRSRTEDLPLCLEAAGWRRHAAAVKGTGFGTNAVRLSTPAHHAAEARHRAEPQEALSALPGRAP